MNDERPILPWRNGSHPQIMLANSGLQYVIWELPSLRYRGRTTYTVVQRWRAGGRMKEFQRFEDVPDLPNAMWIAQNWAWENDTRQGATNRPVQVWGAQPTRRAA